MAVVNYYAKEFSTLESAMAFKKANSVKINRYNNTSDPIKWYFISESEVYNGETLSQYALDTSFIYTEYTNPDSCKIYRYIESPNFSDTIPPMGHNYISGLTVRLHPKRTFVKGELQRVEWFADNEETDLVVCVNIEYVRDPIGFALHRTTIREWIKEDGEAHHDKKTTVKHYDDLAQIKEGEARRSNIISGLQKPILGFLIASEPETAAPILVLQGRDFLKSYQPDFLAFINESHKGVLERLTNDSNYPWLDNPTPFPGVTIRQFLLSQLDLGF